MTYEDDVDPLVVASAEIIFAGDTEEHLVYGAQKCKDIISGGKSEDAVILHMDWDGSPEQLEHIRKIVSNIKGEE